MCFQLTSFLFCIKKKKSNCRCVLRFARPKCLNVQLERHKNHVGSSCVPKNLFFLELLNFL